MQYSTTALILSFAVAVLVGSAAGQANCPNGEDYTPCTCPQPNRVTCSGVSIAEIKAIFDRTTPAPAEVVDLTLQPTDLAIPADLFGSHAVTNELFVRCARTMDQAITVDVNAFRASRDTMLQYEFYYCDISRIDWSFLTGFNNLNYLAIEYLSTVHQSRWETFPSLTGLKTFEVYQCPSGVNEWTNFPVLSTGLTRFYLNADNLQNAAAERILNWVLTSSASTLQTLLIGSNALTSIPSQIPRFTALATLDASLMQAPGLGAIPAGAISFTAPVRTLRLDSSAVSSIGGPITGNFGAATVNLGTNSLTRLDSSIFQPILTQMAASTGSLDVRRNPIDCTANSVCHLAWLVRDNPTLLAPLGGTATCADGTAVADLSPSLFTNCP